MYQYKCTYGCVDLVQFVDGSPCIEGSEAVASEILQKEISHFFLFEELSHFVRERRVIYILEQFWLQIFHHLLCGVTNDFSLDA